MACGRKFLVQRIDVGRAVAARWVIGRNVTSEEYGLFMPTLARSSAFIKMKFENLL
jgi:hypothetical protein